MEEMRRCGVLFSSNRLVYKDNPRFLWREKHGEHVKRPLLGDCDPQPLEKAKTKMQIVERGKGPLKGVKRKGFVLLAL